MSYIEQLEPTAISFIVPLKKMEEVANTLISNKLGRSLPIEIKAEDTNDSLRLLIEVDTSSLEDKDYHKLISIGFFQDEPYNNADTVLSTIFEGTVPDILPLTGQDEDIGTYFVVEIQYVDYLRVTTNTTAT